MKFKKKVACLLAFVMMAVSLGQLTESMPDVHAETAEAVPVYDTKTCISKYESDLQAVAKGGILNFGITIPEDETYYVSYTVKSAAGVYFDYRGSGRLYLSKTQYCVLGVNGKQDWVQGATGIENGTNVVLKITSDKVTLWLNGKIAIEDAVMDTKGAGVPKVTWTEDEAEFTGIRIWTVSDEPVYDAIAHVSKYESDSQAIAASSTFDFGVTIPEDETYYMSFTLQTTGGVYLDYRGTNQARLYIDSTQFAPIGVNGATKWIQRTTNLATGVRITICSEPDKTSMWFGGEKVLTDATLDTIPAVGAPKVTWTTKETTLTDIRIWKTRTENDEAVYDAARHVKKYESDSQAIAASSTFDFGVTIPEDKTYYMSYTVKSTAGIWFDYRGSGRLYIDARQYCVVGVNGKEDWIQKVLGIENGVHVTLKITSDKVTIWLNGEKAIENAVLNTKGAGVPKITWTVAETVLSDIQIWTDPSVSLNGCTATLDGSIGLNFFMNVDLLEADKVSDGTYMLFTVPGEADQKVVLKTLGENAQTENGYKFTCRVPAKKMADKITAQFYVNGKPYSESYEYSVEAYAKTIINDTAETYSENAKKLAANMLHYGAYSQKYFNYNTANLANEGLTALDLSAVTVDNFASFTEGNVKTVEGLGSNKGSNLILESETTLKLYFAPEDGVENLQFVRNGEMLPTSEVISGGKTWVCIPITNIAADKLGDTIEITVSDSTDSSKSGTLKYSALTYGYNVLKSTTSYSDELQNLVKALYLYNQAAVAYKSQN